MTFTVGEVLFLLAALGLVVFLAWGTTILEALTTFNDWVGKKWKEQQEKNRRTGGTSAGLRRHPAARLGHQGT